MYRFFLFAATVMAPALVATSVERNWTEAENLGFCSSVDEVATTTKRFQKQILRDGEPLVVTPQACNNCRFQFDRFGNKIREWDAATNGRQTFELETDDQGRPTIQHWFDASGQEVSRTEYVVGPHGWIESSSFYEGNLTNRETRRYDELGRLIEIGYFDRTGKQTGYTTIAYDRLGRRTFEKTQRKEDHFDFFSHVVQIYDPVSESQTFTSYDRNGNVRVTWRSEGGKLLNIYVAPGEKEPYGTGLVEKTSQLESKSRQYSPDGTFTTVHKVFTDVSRRHPSKITWVDRKGKIRYRLEFLYQFDSIGNWTSRSVSNWTPESKKSELIEQSQRVIRYHAGSLPGCGIR